MSYAITGMACRSCAGDTPDSLLTGLMRARENVSYALGTPLFRLSDSCFPAGRRDSARDIRDLADLLISEALANAGLGPSHDETRDETIGLVLGTTGGTSLHFLASYRTLRAGTPLPPENDLTDYFTSSLALTSAPFLRGPRLTLSDACTTGADTLALAADMLAQGVCPCVVCGGVDTVSSVPLIGFSRLCVYGQTACRPFDRDRTGLTLGEGGGIVVLELVDHALARGAEILGLLAGVGQAADAYHPTAPHPEGRGLRTAIAEAMAQAGCAAKDLAFVNAHATATREKDAVEGRVLRDLCPNVPVWGSKGGTGHTLAAAGALEAIASLAALTKGYVPSTPGFETTDPDIGLTPTTSACPRRESYALSTSLGFGGGATALVLSTWDALRLSTGDAGRTKKRGDQ